MSIKTKIAIKKLNALVLGNDPVPAVAHDSTQSAATIATSMLSLGFVPSEKLFRAMAVMPEADLIDLHRDVIGVMQELKGAHVRHQPMYPNFPQQVMETSTVELFFNAIGHYWTAGQWTPTYEVLPRDYHSENIKFVEIGLATDAEFRDIFRQLLGSNDSLSEEDKGYIEWFMQNEPGLPFPEKIPFKENMCVVAGMFIKAGMQPDELMRTATDVLRVITYLNGGDVSLAQPTKYKSLPRAQRRMFARLLDDRASEEDIHRHRGKWTRVFHSLHIGEFSKKYPNICKIAVKVRNNEAIRTFNGRVDLAITGKNAQDAVALLQQRPGEFARRLDHLFRLFGDTDDARIIGGFVEVADKIPTRVLLQVLGHLQTRDTESHARTKGQGRVIFPKGSVQKARILPVNAPLNDSNVAAMRSGIEGVLVDRFASMETLGKVYIDPELAHCPLPSQQRSASEGMFNVARGTKLPFGDDTKTTLRFFVHWVNPGQRSDLDLSAALYDADFNFVEAITYYNLKSDRYQACHSGDKTNAPAPRGASEFIDITIDDAAKFGRYVVMDVRCFTGHVPFSTHEVCFAGWMTREKPQSNEIFDAKTVENKVDLRANTRNVIPAVFDLVERKMIWCDISGSSRGSRGGNNVASNRASIQQTLRAVAHSHNKVSLHKLFELHARGRGELVDTPEDADTVFSLNQGITPYDINTINSDFLA